MWNLYFSVNHKSQHVDLRFIEWACTLVFGLNVPGGWLVICNLCLDLLLRLGGMTHPWVAMRDGGGWIQIPVCTGWWEGAKGRWSGKVTKGMRH